MNMIGPDAMSDVSIQGLLVRLEAARRQAILAAAAAESRLDYERLAHVQMALMAVREEIAAHAPKVGFGSETPVP